MIPKELIKKIRQIQIYTSRTVDASFAGQYESVFKGRGMQFDEVREYTPGDDIRTIDWNVTARTGRPYIKRYVEEREMTVMFAVDLSASGDFGTAIRWQTKALALVPEDVKTELQARMDLYRVGKPYVEAPGKED